MALSIPLIHRVDIRFNILSLQLLFASSSQLLTFLSETKFSATCMFYLCHCISYLSNSASTTFSMPDQNVVKFSGTPFFVLCMQEILLLIFEKLPPKMAWAFMLVCRGWKAPAVQVLYSELDFRVVASVIGQPVLYKDDDMQKRIVVSY